jgi:selenide,water dikinase
MASENDLALAIENMKMLNKAGAAVMKKFNVCGATDITGYGLAGHALKMARASGVTISLKMSSVKLIGDCYRLVDEGCIPGAAFRNLEFVEVATGFDHDLDYNLKMIAMDAQTSGGLLMCVPENSAEDVIHELHTSGLMSASIIGSVLPESGKFLLLRN